LFSTVAPLQLSSVHHRRATYYSSPVIFKSEGLDDTFAFFQSPDGKYIACGATDGIINIFDMTTGKLMHTLEGHAMTIRSLCFSPDSQLLITASDDGHIKMYDV
jgi:WD40 repeat protein